MVMAKTAGILLLSLLLTMSIITTVDSLTPGPCCRYPWFSCCPAGVKPTYVPLPHPPISIAISSQGNVLPAHLLRYIETMSSNPEKMEVASWDGSLSRTEFYVAAGAFAEQWNKFNSALPQCSWLPRSTLPWLSATTSQTEGYLSVENMILPNITREFNECNDEEIKEDLSFSDDDGFTDNAMLAENHSQESCHYDFHIVYNSSYRVPVLYFRAAYSDGQPVALDDIEKNIASSAKALMESKWTFITQEDHPYLNRPWYTLHPCGTREWMKMLFMNEHLEAQNGDKRIAKYLVSWFSVVGQVFGLKIPLQMLGNWG
ncbi:hypothetical protein M9H77_19874 [Catharanthus roseus]|uniref:Uncharacterized protein n=1 Tax=Catharanthus roseus TaxID=4058 RepID=A0ACC0BBK0_CATRO|nr:hypothetical protein M9H77_19874 [Catharanthus roseus]